MKDQSSASITYKILLVKQDDSVHILTYSVYEMYLRTLSQEWELQGTYSSQLWPYPILRYACSPCPWLC